MFYLLFIPAILMQLFLLHKLNLVRRTDAALFRLCAYNSDLISFLASKEGRQLSTEDYLYIRSLLRLNEYSIDQFNEVIRAPFTFRAVLKGVRYVDKQLLKSEWEPDGSDNLVLQLHYHNLVYNLSKSMLTFNPLLRQKKLLAAGVLVGEAAARLGIKKVKEWTLELSQRAAHIVMWQRANKTWYFQAA